MDNLAGTSEEGLVAARLAEVLASVGTLTTSSSKDDQPWAAGGYFVEDGLFTLGMILETHGTTMTNIRSNPQVAVSITTGNPYEPFAQGLAHVEVLSDEATIAAVHAALEAKSPAITPLLGMPVETVRFHVRTWKVSDLPNGWVPAKVLHSPAEVAAR